MFTVIIVVCSPKNMSYVLIGCCVSELHGPYRNVWPEAVYCFLQELHCLPNRLSFTAMFTVIIVVCSLKSM